MEVLADFPVVGLAVTTAHVREIAWPGIEVFYMFQIFLAVEGVHVKAFRGFPYEFLVEIGSFEVLDNHIHPFLGRNGRKFGKKSFLVLFHDAGFCKIGKRLLRTECHACDANKAIRNLRLDTIGRQEGSLDNGKTTRIRFPENRQNYDFWRK